MKLMNIKVSSPKISSKSKRISEFIIDEILFKVGLEYFWLWIATIKPGDNQILALLISKRWKMFVVAAERFIS